MNFVVIIACLAMLVATAHGDSVTSARVYNVMRQCAVDQGITDAELESYMKMENDDERKFGCARACLFNKYNWLQPGFKVNPNAAHELINQMFDDSPGLAKVMNNVIDHCVEKVPSNPDECIYSLEFAKCYHASLNE